MKLLLEGNGIKIYSNQNEDNLLLRKYLWRAKLPVLWKYVMEECISERTSKDNANSAYDGKSNKKDSKRYDKRKGYDNSFKR